MPANLPLLRGRCLASFRRLAPMLEVILLVRSIVNNDYLSLICFSLCLFSALSQWIKTVREVISRFQYPSLIHPSFN